MMDFDVNDFVEDMDHAAGFHSMVDTGLDDMDLKSVLAEEDDADENDDWTDVWVFSHSDWVDGGDGFLYEYHFYYDWG